METKAGLKAGGDLGLRDKAGCSWRTEAKHPAAL